MSEQPKSADPNPAINRIIRCPNCAASCRYDDTNENRPFCSVPCRNHDIVNWAEGTYRVPGPPAIEFDKEGALPSEEEDEEAY